MGVCKLCDVPFSTNATRVYCLYCGYSKDFKVKQQDIVYSTDGVSTLFKLPTFNRVHDASIVVEVDGNRVSGGTRAGTFSVKHINSETFIKMSYALAPGHKIRIEWEDYKG